MASLDGPHPACGVHPSGCAVRGPAVRPAGVHPSGVHCLASTRPAGWCPTRPVSNPSGVRPPSVRTRPSPPTYGGGVGDQVEAARRPSPQPRVEVPAAAAPSGGSLDSPGGLAAGEVAEVAVVRRVGGGTGPGWVRAAAARARCATRQARPACAERPMAGGFAVGPGAGCSARWLHLPRGCRPRAGWATTLRGSRGGSRPGGRACKGRWGVSTGRACGPDAAHAGSGRPRLAAGSAVTCGNGWWACQDLNLGPHPYQVSTVTRRAIRPFSRSRRS